MTLRFCTVTRRWFRALSAQKLTKLERFVGEKSKIELIVKVVQSAMTFASASSSQRSKMSRMNLRILVIWMLTRSWSWIDKSRPDQLRRKEQTAVTMLQMLKKRKKQIIIKKISSTRRTTICIVVLWLFTPENTKRRLQILTKVRKLCMLIRSCTPETSSLMMKTSRDLTETTRVMLAARLICQMLASVHWIFTSILTTRWSVVFANVTINVRSRF